MRSASLWAFDSRGRPCILISFAARSDGELIATSAGYAGPLLRTLTTLTCKLWDHAASVLGAASALIALWHSVPCAAHVSESKHEACRSQVTACLPGPGAQITALLPPGHALAGAALPGQTATDGRRPEPAQLCAGIGQQWGCTRAPAQHLPHGRAQLLRPGWGQAAQRRLPSLAQCCAARRATDEDKQRLIDSHDCFIFDCDGVHWTGQELVCRLSARSMTLRRRHLAGRLAHRRRAGDPEHAQRRCA